MADTQQSSKNNWSIKSWPEFIVSLLTLIFVGVYAGYSRQQVTETQNANTIALKGFEENSKPYVLFSGLFPMMLADINKPKQVIGIVWTNYGNTPATNGVWYPCQTIIREDFIPPIYRCEAPQAAQKFPVIGPKQTISMLGPTVSEEDIDATADTRKSVYVFGYFTYEDTVVSDEQGRPKPRVTSFCQRIIKQRVTVNSVLGPGGPTPEQAQIKELEDRLSQKAPWIGVGCQNFDYCVDSNCKPLPQ